jgi:hypothetical protein
MHRAGPTNLAFSPYANALGLGRFFNAGSEVFTFLELQPGSTCVPVRGGASLEWGVAISRHDFLLTTAASAAVIPLGLRAQTAIALASGRFQHGVASGDPLTDRVMLWTRVADPEVVHPAPGESGSPGQPPPVRAGAAGMQGVLTFGRTIVIFLGRGVMQGYRRRPVFVLGTHRNSNPRNAKAARSSVIVRMRVFSVLSDTPIASASERMRARARSAHAFPLSESGVSTTRAFTHRCGPRTRSPRRTGFVSGLHRGISHAGATQAMRLRSLTASGLSPYGSSMPPGITQLFLPVVLI